MRKTRVELTSGLVAMIILVAVTVSLLVLSGTGQYVPISNEYSSYELAVNPPSADFVYPLANYSLVRGLDTSDLFSRVGLQDFESGIEFTGDVKKTHADQYGDLNIHEIPSTVIEYNAEATNYMKFELAIGTGAIKKGSAVIVGSEDAGGVFVMSGGATVTISGQDVVFMMPPGSTVIFRADTLQEQAIGSAVAEGLVSAEMYLLKPGWTVGEDVVAYDGTDIYTVAASEEIVDVQVMGTSSQKSVVVHVANSYLDYDSADDLRVTLDGKKVAMGAGMTETLWGGGEEPSYFASKTAEGYDVVVYIPQNADSVISISGPEAELGVDGLVTLLAAIGIVGVAVVALIKND